MSAEYDKRKAVRLEPETVKAIEKVVKKFRIKPSLPKLVNEAARLGLPLLSEK